MKKLDVRGVTGLFGKTLLGIIWRERTGGYICPPQKDKPLRVGNTSFMRSPWHLYEMVVNPIMWCTMLILRIWVGIILMKPCHFLGRARAPPAAAMHIPTPSSVSSILHLRAKTRLPYHPKFCDRNNRARKQKSQGVAIGNTHHFSMKYFCPTEPSSVNETAEGNREDEYYSVRWKNINKELNQEFLDLLSRIGQSPEPTGLHTASRPGLRRILRILVLCGDFLSLPGRYSGF